MKMIKEKARKLYEKLKKTAKIYSDNYLLASLFYDGAALSQGFYTPMNLAIYPSQYICRPTIPAEDEKDQ